MARLATGRVYAYVARDAIVVGAIGKPAEPAARAPVFVTLPGRRIGIVLGAAEWHIPGAELPALDMQAEIPRLLGELSGPKRLEQEAASDLEELGLALLEPLRGVVARIHRKLELGPDEPVFELVLVGYTTGYGPEVWSLRYRVAQDFLRDDFWRTRILRPMYIQHYPPEKGQPRTLVETRHPAADAEPTLLELLGKGDPRVAGLRADPRIARALALLEKGESHKALGADAAELMRAALRAIAPPESQPVVGLISEQRGLTWIIPPPEPIEKAEDEKREPGAPTLRKRPL